MTEREKWWLTATVWMEARGEPAQGQYAVACVILNRLRRKKWGRTVGEVVLAPKQFSCWNSESPTRAMLARCDEAGPSWLACVKAVEKAIEGRTDDPTGNALHYFNPSVVKPFWDKPRYPRVTIGHHVFVRDVP